MVTVALFIKCNNDMNTANYTRLLSVAFQSVTSRNPISLSTQKQNKVMIGEERCLNDLFIILAEEVVGHSKFTADKA